MHHWRRTNMKYVVAAALLVAIGVTAGVTIAAHEAKAMKQCLVNHSQETCAILLTGN